MCRFLAYAAAEPRAVADLLGPEELASFKGLSRLHRDGWGMAFLSGPDEMNRELSAPAERTSLPAAFDRTLVEGRLRAVRSVLPAYEDPAFDALTEKSLAAAGFVHLRWATSGLAVTEANTHPFLSDGWAFAHQGSIPNPERLDALLAPQWRSKCRGTTDSERYFLYLLQCVESEGRLESGLVRAVTDILDACGPASLNAVLLSSTSLVVVHGKAGLEPPRDDILAAFASPLDVPADHLDGYFRLRLSRRDGDILISSSGVSGDDWEDIPDDSILHVDLQTRSTSIHPLAAAG